MRRTHAMGPARGKFYTSKEIHAAGSGHVPQQFRNSLYPTKPPTRLAVPISEYANAPPRGKYGWMSLTAAMENTVMTVH